MDKPFDWKDLPGECIIKIGKEEVPTLQCLPGLFAHLIVWLFALAGVAALIFIIIGGIKFITSGGDAKQVEGARKTLTYAIIGLIVILLSFAIINFISDLTGVTCIKVFGFGGCNNAQIRNDNTVLPGEVPF